MLDLASRSHEFPLPQAEDDPSSGPSWETELFVLQGDSREQLHRHALDLHAFVERSPQLCLQHLAATLASELQPHTARLAIVAGSAADLRTRLQRAAERLADPRTPFIKDSAGIYFFSEPLYRQGHLVLLFPGEGAQYLNMLADLLPHFPEVRQVFEEADRGRPITPTFLVPATAAPEEKAAAEKRLRSLEYSIATVLLANVAMYAILRQLEVPASAVAGHSAGELTALWVAGGHASGQLTLEQVLQTMADLESPGGGRAGPPETLLLAVGAGRPLLTGLIQELAAAGSVFLAMDNCPHQCVLVGDFQATARIEAALQTRGIVCERLPFHRPYHTPRFEPFMDPLRRMFDGAQFHAPRVPIYCCTTGQRFPDSAAAVRDLTLAHWTSPVEFARMVQTMYADGARLFVETGPRGNLTAFVEDILRGQPVAAVAANVARRSGITQLNHLAGQLIAHEVPLRLGYFHERRQPQPVAWRSSEPAPTERGEVMGRYFAVMEEFLQLQQQVTEQFLAGAPSGDGLPIRPPVESSSGDGLPIRPTPTPWIMLGDILHHDPGRELTSRRRLHLDEDLYARHHSLGGTDVSRVDPAQHGSPVLPMTFSLETLAEVAQALFPQFKVVGLENVRLHRWIPFADDAPTILEVRASVLPQTEGEAPLRVSAAIYDCGHSSDNPETPRQTVEATVLLAPEYPPSPTAEITLANARPCRINREQLYHSLFHGPMFRGVESTDRLDDKEIEGQVCVPARDRWFRSTPTPALVLDPVLMDMTMHVLAGWHLEQPDQAGRILLPFKLDRIEFFGPMPAAGALLTARAASEQETPRYARHGIEVLDEQGRILYRMKGAWYWRFYLPFQGKINFNSPKDEYFLSVLWPEAQPAPETCCMVVEPAADLQQTLLQTSMARVTSTPEELRQYLSLPPHPLQRTGWLFTRLVAKDAARHLWWTRGGERLLPADMELDLAETGVGRLRPRDPANRDAYPLACTARLGDKMAALAPFQGRPGIALAQVPDNAEASPEGLDAKELRWLDRFGADRAETLTRFACARRAVVQALAPELPGAEVGLAVRGGDPASGLVLMALGPALAEACPAYRLELLRVQTARRQDLVIATTLCEKAD